jgi:hypothetical protein
LYVDRRGNIRRVAAQKNYWLPTPSPKIDTVVSALHNVDALQQARLEFLAGTTQGRPPALAEPEPVSGGVYATTRPDCAMSDHQRGKEDRDA